MKVLKIGRQRLKRRRSYSARHSHKLEILEMMPKGSVCAEVGVWKGDLSAAILRVVRPAKLHLIDPWAFMTDEPYKKAWYGGAVAKSQQDMTHMYQEVLERFANEIREGTVEVHRSPSEQSTETFANDYFDWVYIDGNHLYEFVKRDLHGFYPKVKKGGYLAGDDYTAGGWFGGGVKKAVDEFLATGSVDLTFLKGTQFILSKI